MTDSGEEGSLPSVPTRREGESSSTFLARVLTDEGAPEWMVSLATENHYDDFKSPLAMPETQLHADALANDLPQVAAWVVDGIFDATKAESDEWAASPEGQAVFNELLNSRPKPGPNRAQRRADDRRRRRNL